MFLGWGGLSESKEAGPCIGKLPPKPSPPRDAGLENWSCLLGLEHSGVERLAGCIHNPCLSPTKKKCSLPTPGTLFHYVNVGLHFVRVKGGRWEPQGMD
jgi:hypothetical protein